MVLLQRRKYTKIGLDYVWVASWKSEGRTEAASDTLVRLQTLAFSQ